MEQANLAQVDYVDPLNNTLGGSIQDGHGSERDRLPVGYHFAKPY